MSAPKNESGRALNFNGTVAEALAKGLVRHGVNLVFGQSLPSALHLAAKSHGIRQAWYRTENAGGAMADAFARVSHRVGVVTAQNGPAATLLVPPLAEALKASVPVVALVQEVALSQTDKNAFQEYDHLALFGACTKWVRRLDQPSRVDDYLDMAFRAAVSGRPGPAALLLPADLLLAPYQAGPVPRTQSLGCYPLERTMPGYLHLEQAADMLANAQRPLIIAGGGVHLSGAAEELAMLQETAGLPVATTVMGKGAVDENHPLSLGVVGYFMGAGGASKFQRELVSQADLVLLVGNRTNQNGTDSWSLYPQEARYIHIDADPMEIGRNYEALPLVGDAKLILSELLALLESRELSKRLAARPALEAKIAQGKERHRQEAKGLHALGAQAGAARAGHERAQPPPHPGHGGGGRRQLFLHLGGQLPHQPGSGHALHHPAAAWPGWAGACPWPWGPSWPGQSPRWCVWPGTAASDTVGPSWRRPAAWVWT